jgi:hypothetical protein
MVRMVAKTHSFELQERREGNCQDGSEHMTDVQKGMIEEVAVCESGEHKETHRPTNLSSSGRIAASTFPGESGPGQQALEHTPTAWDRDLAGNSTPKRPTNPNFKFSEKDPAGVRIQATESWKAGGTFGGRITTKSGDATPAKAQVKELLKGNKPEQPDVHLVTAGKPRYIFIDQRADKYLQRQWSSTVDQSASFRYVINRILQ